MIGLVKRRPKKTMPLLRRQLYLAAVLIPPLLAVLAGGQQVPDWCPTRSPRHAPTVSPTNLNPPVTTGHFVANGK